MDMQTWAPIPLWFLWLLGRGMGTQHSLLLGFMYVIKNITNSRLRDHQAVQGLSKITQCPQNKNFFSFYIFLLFHFATVHFSPYFLLFYLFSSFRPSIQLCNRFFQRKTGSIIIIPSHDLKNSFSNDLQLFPSTNKWLHCVCPVLQSHLSSKRGNMN